MSDLTEIDIQLVVKTLLKVAACDEESVNRIWPDKREQNSAIIKEWLDEANELRRIAAMLKERR